ncbi:MAG TPA: histidine kinase [Beijerinckiaceae bacterium]|nr:histidine kinase [Beijerinckiaceae bacterium]
MPTLFRFLFVVGVLAALVYGAMLALVTFVQPQPREMTQTVPASKLNK